MANVNKNTAVAPVKRDIVDAVSDRIKVLYANGEINFPTIAQLMLLNRPGCKYKILQMGRKSLCLKYAQRKVLLTACWIWWCRVLTLSKSSAILSLMATN